MVFVRQAILEDLDPLSSFDEWKQATEASIRAGECLVAGHDTEIQAYGIFNHSFCGRACAAVIFVHPTHRRTGLGSALIKHMESETDQEKLWISTNLENLAMQRTLQRLGYRLAGVINNMAELPELFYFKVVDPGKR